MPTDEVLWLLRDGEWHDLREVVKTSSLPRSQVTRVVNFLREFNLVEVDKTRGRVRMSPLMLKFIDEIRYFEKEEALSTRVHPFGATGSS